MNTFTEEINGKMASLQWRCEIQPPCSHKSPEVLITTGETVNSSIETEMINFVPPAP